MLRTRITKNEVALLGILSLLVLLIALTPWKKLILRYSEYQTRKYDFSGVVTESGKQRQTPATWQVQAQYSPESSALEVNLSHRHNAPFQDLWVLAEFSSHPSGIPEASTIMQQRSGGVFRSDDVRLTKGDWLMSLTGIRREQFLFRREQMLKVN